VTSLDQVCGGELPGSAGRSGDQYAPAGPTCWLHVLLDPSEFISNLLRVVGPDTVLATTARGRCSPGIIWRGRTGF